MRLMGLHYGPTEIARNLGVRRKTVETYQARLRAKFQLSTTREVRHFAVLCCMADAVQQAPARLLPLGNTPAPPVCASAGPGKMLLSK